MKLCISNIAWDSKLDESVYEELNNFKFDGLEIAPTKWILEEPYQNILLAKKHADSIKSQYGLSIYSMQSICFGKSENFFRSESEFISLMNHCKLAVDFAHSIDCRNLVFGCPKNRNIPILGKLEDAARFFIEIAEYAKSKKCIISLEPNPKIYGTNFLNTTHEAWLFVKGLNHTNLKLNLDLGTIMMNHESLNQVTKMINEIGHVHLSMPKLMTLYDYEKVSQLIKILKTNNYDKAISIEMLQTELSSIREIIKRVSEAYYA